MSYSSFKNTYLAELHYDLQDYIADIVKKNQLRLGEGQEMRWFTFHEILSLSDHGFKVGHNVIQVLNIAKSKI